MRTVLRLAAAAALVAPAAAQAELIYGITVPGVAAPSNLVSFDSANPAAVSTVAALSGLNAGHTIRGIDFRPSNGLLYAVSTADANPAEAQLYTVDLATAAASAVGSTIAIAGNTSGRVSVDFNPVPNALRVVTGSGQSYRFNANTGVLIAQDTSILDGADTPLISGVAYNNNLPGVTQTTLYAYDFVTDTFGTIGGVNGVPSPNGGVFNAIGPSGIVTGDAGAGFDISSETGTAYFSVDDFNGSAGANAEFFTVNLATGTFTQVGPDEFAPVLDISVKPVIPEPSMLAAGAMALSSMFLRRRRA